MDSSIFSFERTKALLKDNASAFSLIHFNIRSLRKHYDDVCAFFSVIDHTFSFICLSETWLTSHDGALYGIPGYISEYCHREDSRGGGSAVLVDSTVPYRRRLDVSLSTPLCESVCIEIDHHHLPMTNRNTVILSLYRSPSSSYAEFCAEFEVMLNKLIEENKNVVICGDININIADQHSQSCSEYVRCCLGCGFSSVIRTPTRYDSNTFIDHILVSLPTDDITAGVLDYATTDHYPIFLFRV